MAKNGTKIATNDGMKRTLIMLITVVTVTTLIILALTNEPDIIYQSPEPDQMLAETMKSLDRIAALDLKSESAENKRTETVNAGDDDEPNIYVTVLESYICGHARLGNKMFEIAAAVGAVAVTPGTAFVLVNTTQCEWVGWLQELFDGMARAPLFSPEEVGKWPHQGEADFSRKYEIKVDGNTSLAGYRQAHGYFTEDERQIQAIRKAFKFTTEYENKGKAAYDEIWQNRERQNDHIVVGVHMRLSDMLDEARLTYGYQVANTSFYTMAFRTAMDRYGNTTIFAVATDSSSLAKEILAPITSQYTMHFFHGNAFVDFAALTLCNHVIMSGGTFGFWAAWLAGGDVIYFANFAKEGTQFHQHFCSECFYPDSWTSISVKSHSMQTKTVKPAILTQQVETTTINNNPASNTTAKLYITVIESYLCGHPRLGNKMFVIAAAIGAASITPNISFAMLNSTQCPWTVWLRELFQGIAEETLLQAEEVKDWPNKGEPNFSRYYPIEPKGNITIAGYRQAKGYFTNDPKQSRAVRRAFRFTSKYQTAAKAALDEILTRRQTDDDVIVGVHMRLGDMLQEARVTYGYQAANTSFYEFAFKTMTSKHDKLGKSVLFAVASDSLPLAKEILAPISNSYNIQYFDGDAFIDFASLTLCKHVIMSGGTFGFWAAWLAGGDVIYYSNFAKNGTKFYQDFCSDCFYPETWVGLS